ncbi:MAG: ParB/RepB/Spo0J family partition protein [Burkholderiaceae bacterium]
MVSKKSKGLGRGLEALLGPQGPHDAPSDAMQWLPLHRLQAGVYQPRTVMDEGALYELAESIRQQGVMQPLLVRALNPAQGTVTHEIIAGERRFRAAALAGLDEVPVLIREVDNQGAAAMALIENMQREDLNALEEATGLQRLIQEFGLTHDQAAQAVGRSRSAATNLLRLLHLAEPVQSLLTAGDISMGHARALLALDKATQITAAHQMAVKRMSVREAEALVKKLAAEFTLKPSRPTKEKNRDIRRVEDELSDWLGAAVEVRLGPVSKRAGRQLQTGEMRLKFGSLDELNGIIDRIRAGKPADD